MMLKTLISFLLICSSFSTIANQSSEQSAMQGLRTTVYYVNDLNKASDWYGQAFDIKPYFVSEYYIGFNIRGYELGLMPTKQRYDNISTVVSYWGVDNVDKQYQKLLDLGAKAGDKVMDVGGGIRLGTVIDPFGNPLGVIYNPTFKVQN